MPSLWSMADFSESIERIKKDHIKQMIERYNIYKIENHPLRDEVEVVSGLIIELTDVGDVWWTEWPHRLHR